MAARLEGGADAVLINCLQMDGEVLRAVLDRRFRRDDGALQISSDDCARILVEHLPEYNFVDAGELPRTRLRICWRVGADGILIHGNHYHPICLRPKAFAHPLQLTIDPIDSRFIDRSSLEMDRIHLVQDASIVGLSLEDDALPEQLEHGGTVTSNHRCRLLVVGILGPAPGDVLSVAAAFWLRDFRRGVGARRGCRLRRCRCHRRSGGAVRREPAGEKVVAPMISGRGGAVRSATSRWLLLGLQAGLANRRVRGAIECRGSKGAARRRFRAGAGKVGLIWPRISTWLTCSM